jgi:signal transduction histidine kinase
MLKKTLIAIALLLFALGVMATIDLPNQQPRLPVALGGQSGLEVVGPSSDFPSHDHDLRVGDKIVSIGDKSVSGADFLNFILDGMRVGQRVTLQIDREGVIEKAQATLVPFLTDRLLLINAIVALWIWFFGMIILSKGAGDKSVLLFFGMAMTLSTVMAVYWPENKLCLPWGDRLCWFLSNGFYPFTVALVLHFAIYFPEKSGGLARRLVPYLYIPTVAIAAWLIVSVARARSSLAIADFTNYQTAFSVFRVYLAVYFIAGPIIWIFKYKRTRQYVTRQRLKWLIWGFTVGIAPHVLLNELPKGLGFRPILPEEITYICALFSATAVLIGVARYRLLDVDLVINKSLVYSSLTLFVVGAYLLLVGLGDYLMAGWLHGETGWVRVGAILLLAAIFAPAQNLAQTFVDKVFFRSRYDQRLALMDYSRDLAHTIDIGELAEKLSGLFDRVIPNESLVVFAGADDGKTMVEIFASVNAPSSGTARLDDALLETLGVVGRNSSFLAPPGASGLNAEVLVPLRAEERLVGLIAFGTKRSGLVYGEEDLHFIDAVADQTAVAFERARAFKIIKDLNVSLEQRVYERTAQLAEVNDRLVEQYHKLKELDEMKEAMTRMIVHDLRNPVSTIMLGLDFLDRDDVGGMDQEVRHALEVIRNTAGEMKDLISDLLDIARLESGKLSLEKQVVPVGTLVEDSAKRLKVMAHAREVEILAEVGDDVNVDVDVVLMTRVLVNLLANAIKFSSRKSVIELSTRVLGEDGDRQVCLDVTNTGPIIPDELHEKIFEKFFQAKSGSAGFKGIGLGLAFCKMVVQAHEGRIELRSPAPGRKDGARFSAILACIT